MTAAAGTGAVIPAGRDVVDRAGIAELHGLSWSRARRAQPWHAPDHPKPVTTGQPTHGHPQLWDRQQAVAFALGQPVPALPGQPHGQDLLDRFTAAQAAGVNPVAWARDVYDGRVPAPDVEIHGGDWWYRDTVETYRRQRDQPRPADQPLGRPAGRTERLPRGQIRAAVAALVAEATDTGRPINIAEIARELQIHYTTALHHVHALTATPPADKPGPAASEARSPKPQ